MEIRNPEWTDRLVSYQLRQIEKGISWTESLRELAKKANLKGFDPDHPTEREFIEMAKHI